MKKILLVFGIVVIVCAMCFAWKLDEYDIRRFNGVVEDGKELYLSEVFPGVWDYVHILHTTPNCDFDFEKLKRFAEENKIRLNLYERFHLLVFTYKENIVGVIQYNPGSGGPTFLDNGVFRELWILSVPREKAVFRCNKVRKDEDIGVMRLESTLYTLELK